MAAVLSQNVSAFRHHGTNKAISARINREVHCRAKREQLNGLKLLFLKAKARIRPWLASWVLNRSTAAPLDNAGAPQNLDSYHTSYTYSTCGGIQAIKRFSCQKFPHTSKVHRVSSGRWVAHQNTSILSWEGVCDDRGAAFEQTGNNFNDFQDFRAEKNPCPRQVHNLALTGLFVAIAPQRPAQNALAALCVALP